MALGHALAITKTYASDRNFANAAIQLMLKLAEAGEPKAVAWLKGLHAATEQSLAATD